MFLPRLNRLALLGLLLWGYVSSDTAGAESRFWCTGYYPGWEQSNMPASSIDFSTVTHVIHFSLSPRTNGGFEAARHGLTAANCSNLVAQAHAAGRKALVCVGGARSRNGFLGATADGNRSRFVAGLLDFALTNHYDGLDLDWEPLEAADQNQFTHLVAELRGAFRSASRPLLLTAAVAYPPTPPEMMAALQESFDQINLMTYDMAGPYPGWVTWFNGAVYDANCRFPKSGELLPSIHGMTSALLKAGVAPGKIGIGIPFYGYVWSGGSPVPSQGVTSPLQQWTTPPRATQASYSVIMSKYYDAASYHWHTNAQAAYLVLDDSGNEGKFISFDDARACAAKVRYAREHHLGGVMIWELGQDHKPGQADPLLGSIKKALAASASESAAR